MRYPASEKLEIIRLVEQSHLPAKKTLSRLGIPKTTFYRWYDRYQAFDEAGLEDRRPHPGRVWNRIPDEIRQGVVDLALDEPELSPRELAFRFTDTKRYFVSDPSVNRILKEHDLITSPAFHVIKAADEFHDKTTRPNQLWQTDFTYRKVIGWGWFYLSTSLDDYSRYVVAWKLCTTMKATDVTDTLEDALAISGCDSATVAHRPRLLSDNGSSYISGDLARWLEARGMDHVRGAPNHPQTQGKIERWHQTLKNRILLENYYLPGALEQAIGDFIDHYNHHRYHESLGNSGLLRQWKGALVHPGFHDARSKLAGLRDNATNAVGERVRRDPVHDDASDGYHAASARTDGLEIHRACHTLRSALADNDLGFSRPCARREYSEPDE